MQTSEIRQIINQEKEKAIDLSKQIDIKNTILMIVEMASLLAFTLIYTIIQPYFDPDNFNWANYILTSFMSLYSYVIATRYASSVYMKDAEITKFKLTISNDKKYIYGNGKTQEFGEEISHINDFRKATVYLYRITKKERKTKDLTLKEEYRVLIKELTQLKKLNKEEKWDECNEIKERINFDGTYIKYNSVSTSNLFNYGTKDTRKGNELDKYDIDSKEAMYGKLIAMAVMLFLNFVLNTMFFNSKATTYEILLQLANYLIIIASGFFYGWKNGESFIKNKYAIVLTNISALVRSIKTKIELNENKEIALLSVPATNPPGSNETKQIINQQLTQSIETIETKKRE